MKMSDVLDLVQNTLDTLLATDGVRSFWGRRAEIDADSQSSEYIIYDWENDGAEVCADGDCLYRVTGVYLNYYQKFGIARTYAGRLAAMDRMESVMKAMRSAGFGCPEGWMEIGDVDQVGFATFRSEYSIPREITEETEEETEEGD